MAGLGTALLTGIPTDLAPNDWFTRMTGIPGCGYLVWVATSVLTAVLVGSHWGVAGRPCPTPRAGAAGGAAAGLAWLAAGCPARSKLVVAAIGASGAMTYFAPV